MSGRRRWSQLSEREREQVQLILCSMKEFSYGVDRLDELPDTGDVASAQQRFYMTALHQYCANYFMITGAHKLRNVLVALDCGDLLVPIEELLSTSLGELTLGEVLKEFRNKFLTHQSFTMEPVDREIGAKFDFTDPENSAALTDLIERLFRSTRQLYVAVAQRFPEALGG